MGQKQGIIKPKRILQQKDNQGGQPTSPNFQDNPIQAIPDFWGDRNGLFYFGNSAYPQSLRMDRRIIIFDDVIDYDSIRNIIGEVDGRISEFVSLKSFITDKFFNEVIHEITNRQNNIGSGLVAGTPVELMKHVINKFVANDESSGSGNNNPIGNIIGFNNLDSIYSKYGLYGFINQLNKLILNKNITPNEIKVYILGKFFNNLLTPEERKLYEQISKKMEKLFEASMGNGKDSTIDTPFTLFIYINTRGGSVNAGFKFIELIDLMKKKIKKVAPEFTFITIGNRVASMGVPIFLTGEKRYISKFSMFLIHPVSTILMGNLPELKSYMKYVETLQDMIANYIYERIDKKLSLQQIKQMMEKETWLEPKDLIKYGFAHGFIEDSEFENII